MHSSSARVDPSRAVGSKLTWSCFRIKCSIWARSRSAQSCLELRLGATRQMESKFETQLTGTITDGEVGAREEVICNLD